MNKYNKSKKDTYKYKTEDVRHIVESLTKLSDKLLPVGGYRRNSPIIHDIDFICLIPLDEMLIKLESLKDNIIKLPTNIKSDRRKIKFDYKICYFNNNINKIENKDKRSTIQIDLFYVKKEEYPFSLLHYTGNYLFNIYMRNIAIKKGYKLNQYGLFLIENSEVNNNKSQDQIKTEKGQINNIKSERNIFDFLNLDWKEPNERDIGELDHKHWNKMATTTGGKKKRSKNTTNSKSSTTKNKTKSTKKIKSIKRLTDIVNDTSKVKSMKNTNNLIDSEDVNVEGGKRKKKRGGILGGLGSGLSKFMVNIFGGNPDKDEFDLGDGNDTELDIGLDESETPYSKSESHEAKSTKSSVTDSRETQLSGLKNTPKKRSSSSAKSTSKSSKPKTKKVKDKCDSTSGGKRKRSSKSTSKKTKTSKK